ARSRDHARATECGGAVGPPPPSRRGRRVARMSIVLDRLLQRYGEHTAVNNVSLEIGDGELFVLLGPSGSGKSTVLRMIAGLVVIEQGSVRLHGRDVTHLPPQRRGVGLVFQ